MYLFIKVLVWSGGENESQYSVPVVTFHQMDAPTGSGVKGHCMVLMLCRAWCWLS